MSRFRSYQGKAQVLIHDRWCDIDESRVLKGAVAPDRGTHVCAPTTPIRGLECLQYCVVIGTGS